MSAYTLRTATTAIAMAAALFGHIATAEAQLGSVLRRAAGKLPRPVAQPAQPVAERPQAGAKPPQAAAKQVRVKMFLVVKGAYQAPAKGEGLVVKDLADNSYSVEYVIPAETGGGAGLQKTNPLDPASRKEMTDYQSKVRMRDARMYGNSANVPTPSAGGAQSGRNPAPSGRGSMPPGMNPMAMDPAVMAKLMACGKDKACQDRLMTEMMSQQMAASGMDPKVAAELQAISNMCINEKHQPMGSKGYEKCLDEEGRKRSTVKSNVVDEPEIPELPDRYLLFQVAELDCQLKGHARVSESTTRSYATLDGSWREETTTSKGEGDADPKGQQCLNERAAFDTKTNTFWLTGQLRPSIPITTVKSGGIVGEPRTETDTIPSDISDWMSSLLEGAPASGSKTETFGHRTATFTWSLVRE
jgi:hypothetical protein